MDLNDMIDARRERDGEEQSRQRQQLDAVWSRLAAILGGADAALSHANDDDRAGLRDAFAAVRDQLVQLLEVHGVELLGRPGEVIDPARHVVEEARDAIAGPPRVVEVLSYGARSIDDHRVLSRARVAATMLATRSRE